MQPYSEKSKCGACGSGWVSTSFVGVTGSTGKDHSYISRRCCRCGYVWREVPLHKAQGDHGLPVSRGGVGIIEATLAEFLEDKTIKNAHCRKSGLLLTFGDASTMRVGIALDGVGDPSLRYELGGDKSISWKDEQAHTMMGGRKR